MDDRGRRDPDDRFEQISRSLMGWVLGPGLLTVHVGVYLVTLVSLLLWNLIRSPSDVWVDGLLRRWGLVVVFHATAVAAGWAAWRLMRMGETSAAPAPRTAPRSWSVAAPPVPQPATSAARPARSATAVATTEEWARRWLRESVRIVRVAVGPNAVTNGNGHDALPERSTASGVAGPGIAEWGTLFARRTREMMSAAREHISPTPHPTNGSAPTAPPSSATAATANPASTWPGAETAAQPLPDSSTPVANGTWPAPANGSAHGADASLMPQPDNGATLESSPGSDRLTTTASDEAREGGTAAMSEDARWTWVEAAAAAWLARREMDEPTAEPTEIPPPPTNEPTATP
jgi:hypothetical protein